MTKTLKDIIPKVAPKVWCLTACEDNIVHYLVIKKGKAKWLNDEVFYEDCRNLIVFDTRKKAKDAIIKCIKDADYPDDVSRFQAFTIIPSYNNEGKIWYNYVNEDIDSANFFEVKVK